MRSLAGIIVKRGAQRDVARHGAVAQQAAVHLDRKKIGWERGAGHQVGRADLFAARLEADLVALTISTAVTLMATSPLFNRPKSINDSRMPCNRRKS